MSGFSVSPRSQPQSQPRALPLPLCPPLFLSAALACQSSPQSSIPLPFFPLILCLPFPLPGIYHHACMPVYSCSATLTFFLRPIQLLQQQNRGFPLSP